MIPPFVPHFRPCLVHQPWADWEEGDGPLSDAQVKSGGPVTTYRNLQVVEWREGVGYLGGAFVENSWGPVSEGAQTVGLSAVIYGVFSRAGEMLGDISL